MTSEFIVDTHALIWYVAGDSRLGTGARAVLEDPASRLIVPAIALAEAYWVVEGGRTSIPSISSLSTRLDADPRFQIAPLDRKTVERAAGLTVIPEMHDRQIVATALLLIDAGASVAVLTKDAEIQNSGLVPIVW